MSVSYQAYVVVGFPATIHQKHSLETRYHEETGIPYKKEIPDYREVRVGDYTFDKEESETLLESDEVKGLTLLYDDYEDPTNSIIGFKLAETRDLNYRQLPQEFNPEIPDEVKEFAKACSLKPSFFLYPSVG